MPKLTLILPIPPSANNYWRMVKGRMLVSKAAREYKEHVGELCLIHKTRPISGNVAVKLDFYRERKAGDLDNRIKVCLDSLKGLAFEDDKQVVEIHARRFDDPKNPRIEVEIREVE